VPPFTRPAAARAPVALTFTRKSMAPGEGHMFQTAKRHYNQQEKKERVLEHKLRLGCYTATNTIHRRSADLFDLNTFMEHVTKFKLKKKKETE
jgi:hypothetical protein